MLSYWEQQSFTAYHHIIIGAGITGLSVAIELAQRFPDERVLVLERGLLPTGATTRNAGFACMGSATELLHDLETTSEAEVTALFLRRKRGLDKLRQRLSDEALGYREDGGYELIDSTALHALGKLDYLNGLLGPALGKQPFRPAEQKLKEFGFAPGAVPALIENTCEGSIHSGRTMRSLTDMALMLGIEIKTGADVVRFEEEEHGATVIVRDPFRDEEWRLAGETLTICTNAFTQKLLPGAALSPGRGQVLITEPVPGLPLKGIFHYDRGYYYFRELDGRVLFGGGRNLDFEGEETTAFALNERIQQDLEQKLREVILPGRPVQIAQRWSGIMAFGPTKGPVVKAFSDSVFGVFRMGGMGVALASEAAAEAVALLVARR